MRSLFIPLIALFLTGCESADSKTAKQVADTGGAEKLFTSIQWIDSVKQMGKISEGQKLSLSFRFRNSGNKPLIIESVEPTCGCTIADYPKEPIAPGVEGEITGSFNSEGREGLQHKTMTVKANTECSGQHEITFEVDVQKKPGAAEAPQ